MHFVLVNLVSKCLGVYIFHYILVGDLDKPSLSHLEFGRLHHPGDMTQFTKSVQKRLCSVNRWYDSGSKNLRFMDSVEFACGTLWDMMKHHNLYTTYIHWRINLRQLTDFQPWVSTLSDFISLLLFLLHHWILSPFVSKIQTFTDWDVVYKCRSHLQGDLGSSFLISKITNYDNMAFGTSDWQKAAIHWPRTRLCPPKSVHVDDVIVER